MRRWLSWRLLWERAGTSARRRCAPSQKRNTGASSLHCHDATGLRYGWPPNKRMKPTVRGGTCYCVGAEAPVPAARTVAAAVRSVCAIR